MIAEELIVQAAKEAKLKVEDKEVVAAIEEIKKQNKLDKAAAYLSIEGGLIRVNFNLQKTIFTYSFLINILLNTEPLDLIFNI